MPIPLTCRPDHYALTTEELSALESAIANFTGWSAETVEAASVWARAARPMLYVESSDLVLVQQLLRDRLNKWTEEEEFATNLLADQLIPMLAKVPSSRHFNLQTIARYGFEPFDLLLSALWNEGLQPEGVVELTPEGYELLAEGPLRLTEAQIEELAERILTANTWQEDYYLNVAGGYAATRSRMAHLTEQIIGIIEQVPEFYQLVDETIDMDDFISILGPSWDSGFR